MPLLNGPLPKHYQLTEILREQILSGQFNAGDRFPTEEQLCQEYGLSRGTVRRALDTLVNEGLLRREQGRGTFVTPLHQRKTFFTLTSFDEVMRRQHRRPSTRLLKAEVIPASGEVMARLQLAASEPVMHIVRLRLADGQPVVYEVRYLAQRLCPGLLEEDLETQSIHWLLIHKYQLPLVRTTHTVEARVLSPSEADLLSAPPGSPAFFVDRLTYTIHQDVEQPAVWYQALYRGDQYQFKAEFQAFA